jgi:hypothetical protein
MGLYSITKEYVLEAVLCPNSRIFSSVSLQVIVLCSAETAGWNHDCT